METVLLMARLFLASILLIAGVAKAIDPVNARKALADFGVPEKMAGAPGWCLPLLEIAAAIALIPTATAWFGAIATLGLMLIFVAAIGVSLALGRTPECNCFGQLHSKPVSWPMFVRNLLLALVAGLVVAQGKDATGLSVTYMLADLKAGELLVLVLSLVGVGLLVSASVHLRRILNEQATVLSRIDAIEKTLEDYAPPPEEREEATPPPEGLPVGALAPDFLLDTIDGGQVGLDDLLDYGKPVLLLFVSSSCAPCESVLKDVSTWERDYSLTIALLSKGSPQENRKRLSKYGARHLLLIGESDVAETYQGRWTPAGVLITRQGRIASHNAYGDADIRVLVSAAAATEIDFEPGASLGAQTNGNGLEIRVGKSELKVGDRTPEFSMSDVDGNVVVTEDLLGRDTLLLFWNPGCPYCRAMSEDVRRWEENPPPGAPQLVFVSSGDLGKVKDESEEFESRFLHDDGFDVGMRLGTRATPSALLIDSEGKIASSIAIGRSNVMLLAGVRNAVATEMSSSS